MNKDENFSRKMEKAAVALNLQPHLCGLNKPLRLSSAADVEGHLGTDGEYYLLDFSRSNSLPYFLFFFGGGEGLVK